MSTLAAKRFDALTSSLFGLVGMMTIEEINDLLANDPLLKGTELAVKLDHRPWVETQQ